MRMEERDAHLAPDDVSSAVDSLDDATGAGVTIESRWDVSGSHWISSARQKTAFNSRLPLCPDAFCGDCPLDGDTALL